MTSNTEDTDPTETPADPAAVYARPKDSGEGTEYTLYLFDIKTPEEYVPWLELLHTATAADTIRFRINSRGGVTPMVFQLLTAMSQCPAHTIASAEGNCCSSATLVFMAAKEQEVSRYSQFLFHTFSWEIEGKGSDMESSISFMKRSHERIYRELYRGFLTDDELARMFDGKDYWMEAQEVHKRLLALPRQRTYLLELEKAREEVDKVG